MAAAGTFWDSLSTWRNPSFLVPLGHQVDPRGPAGLVTGLASVPASREPRTYNHDRPLPLAGRVPAQVQRSPASWSLPSPVRSVLMTAPEVDLSPLPLPAVSAGPAEPEVTGTDPATATPQEPSVTPAEPSAAAPWEHPAVPAVGAAQAGQVPAAMQASPDGRHETARPLVPSRETGHVTAQRQMARHSPQAPRGQRLGLGAPLSRLQDRGLRTPDRPAPAEPGSGSAEPPEPAPEAAVSVQATPADPARPHDLEPPGAGPAEAAAPPGPPRAEAPLIGELPPVTHAVRPAPSPPDGTAPLATAATLAILAPSAAAVPPATSRPGKTTPPLPSGARTAVSRSLTPADPLPGNPQAGQPAPAPVTLRSAGPEASLAPVLQRSAGPEAGLAPVLQPSAGPGPDLASVPPDPHPADQPAMPAGQVLPVARRLPSGRPIATVLPPRAEVAPLLGRRPPVRVLDGLSVPGPLPSPASVTPDAPAGTPVQRSAAGRLPVQGSAAGRSAVSGPRGQAGIVPGGPAAGHREPAAGYPDPGTIAVARGLARREPDGSVVFGLGPSPAPPEPSPPPRQDAPASWYSVAGSQETVQRQEAAGAADEPAPSPGGEPGMASITASAPSPAQAGPSASGAASPPLDELARQLFGPLTARLKAELRLDRERAGLLTDLRQ